MRNNKDNFEGGIKLFNVYDPAMLVKALSYFNVSLSEDPSNLQALYLQFNCLRIIGRLRQAEESLKLMYSINPNGIYFLYSEARLKIDKGTKNEPEETFRKIINNYSNVESKDFLELLLIASSYSRIGEINKQLLYLLKSLELKYTPLIIEEIAICYKKLAITEQTENLREYYQEEATLAFEKLKEFWPQEPSIYQQLGFIYSNMRNMKKTVENFEHESLNNNLDNYYLLAVSHYELKNYSQALKYSKTYLHLEADFSKKLILLSLNFFCLYKLREKEKALEALKTLEEIFNREGPSSDTEKFLEPHLALKETIIREIKKESEAIEEERYLPIKLTTYFKIEKYHLDHINSTPKLKRYCNAFHDAIKLMFFGCSKALEKELEINKKIPVLSELEKVSEQLPFPGKAIIKSIIVTRKIENTIHDNKQLKTLTKVLYDASVDDALLTSIATNVTFIKDDYIKSYKDIWAKAEKKASKLKKELVKAPYGTKEEYLACHDAYILLEFCLYGIVIAIINSTPGSNSGDIVRSAITGVKDNKFFSKNIEISIDTSTFDELLGLNHKMRKAEHNPDEHSPTNLAKSPSIKFKFWKDKPVKSTIEFQDSSTEGSQESKDIEAEAADLLGDLGNTS